MLFRSRVMSVLTGLIGTKPTLSDRDIDSLKGTDFHEVLYRKLRDARLLAHYGSQWLARAMRAYGKARPDDSHTSLGFDERLRALVTHALPDGSRLALRISDLTLSIAERNRSSRVVSL